MVDKNQLELWVSSVTDRINPKLVQQIYKEFDQKSDENFEKGLVALKSVKLKDSSITKKWLHTLDGLVWIIFIWDNILGIIATWFYNSSNCLNNIYSSNTFLC